MAGRRARCSRCSGTALRRHRSAPVFLTNEGTRRFVGPLASPRTLNAYDHMVPGSAQRMIESYLATEEAACKSIQRLTWAEALVLIAGASALVMSMIAGVGISIVLALRGHEIGAGIALASTGTATVAATIRASRRQR